MSDIKITDFMSTDLISLNLLGRTKEEVLKELMDLIGRSENIIDKEKCYMALVNREKLGSTGIGKKVAIPHAKTDYSSKLTIGFGISKKGVDFDSLDDEDTQIFFVFASPLKDSQTYLKILARISRLIRNDRFRNNLISSTSVDEIIELINIEEE